MRIFTAKHTIVAAAVLLLGPPALSAGEIAVGMTTALTGPARALGQGMKIGVETCFNKVNESGGINGNTLKLIALDDGYEPSAAAPNMRELADDYRVLAVIGNVGTPTAIVTVPIANEKKMLLFGAFTGAGVLRKSPPDRYVINYRASYAEETAAMIEGLLSTGIRPEEIAFFTQNDGYGDAGYNGAIKALEAKGFTKGRQLAHGRYVRNTVNIEDGLAEILDSAVEPKAVIMVGAYAPCARFINMARDILPEALFLNVSFVGSVALARELGAGANGVIVTQVVPHYESNRPGVAEYREAMASSSQAGDIGFVSLEGYIAARIFVEGLRKAGTPVTRESLIDAIQELNSLDIGIGTEIGFSPAEHQASHEVWPTTIKNGKYVSLDWGALKR